MFPQDRQQHGPSFLLCFLFTILFPPACGSEEQPTGSDVTESDMVTTDVDPPDLSDELVEDHALDDSLQGTSLEGVAIEWFQPIHLCNRWMMAELEQELSNKLRIQLPPQERHGLGQLHLDQATVGGLLVESSPFADGRWRPSPSDVNSRLVSWELTEQEGAAQLRARIEHDMGSAGVLFEHWHVSRESGAPLPVEVSAGEVDLHFEYSPADREEQIPLMPCEGYPDWVDVVAVLIGTRDEAHLQITRYWRMPYRESDPGDAPIALQATTIQQPVGQELTNIFALATLNIPDFWAQTYSASENHSDESSLLDFTRALIPYHTLFGPHERGDTVLLQQAPTQLAFPSTEERTAVLSFTTLDLNSGEQETLDYDVWPVTRPNTQFPYWRRIDEDYLFSQINGRCAGGRSFTIGFSYSARFQVLTCPREQEPGFEVVAVAPIVFPFDPLLTGQLVWGEDIHETGSNNNPTFVLQIGPARVELTPLADVRWLVNVFEHEGEEPLESMNSPETPLVPPLTADDGETITLESADGTVLVQLNLLCAGLGGGMTLFWVPLSLQLTIGEQIHIVDALDRLVYTNTHHNEFDWLAAETDELGIHLSKHWDAELQRHWRIRVTRPDDEAVILDDTILQ